jgi:hypothetical protein
MPKENTHLLFAYETLLAFQETDLLREVSRHIRHYLLGSIIPDTFYYSGARKIEAISESFHGRTGNPTNVIILAVLDGARTPEDLAFILGYITHCALDITFHPIIYYLSGNYYDTDARKRARVVYMHRHLETCLDRDLNNTLRLHAIIRTAFLKGLVFEKIVSREFTVSVAALRHSLLKQIISNLIFTSRAAYRLALLAARYDILKDTSHLGLFYADVANGECLPPSITVADLVTGSERTVTAGGLFAEARQRAVVMMEAAFCYKKGMVGREELLQAIPGLSLDTGKMLVGASNIRYTKD